MSAAVAVIAADMAVGPDGVVTTDEFSTLQLRGDFLNASTRKADFDLSAGTVQLHGQGEQLFEATVDRAEHLLRDDSAGHGRLVRDDDGLVAHVLKLDQRPRDAGQQLDLVGVADVAGVGDQSIVTV